MLATISNSLIPKLKPKSKPYDVRDDKLTGFFIRVNISGKMLYMCEYARGKRVTIGKVNVLSAVQARDIAKEILADAVKGLTPSTPKKEDKKTTLLTFIEEHYKPWAETHYKRGNETITRIKAHFSSDFGDKPLEEITSWLIEKWRTQRFKEGIKATTINRDIAALKGVFSRAVEWDFIPEHPLKKLKLSKVDSISRIRYLTDTEECRLRQALEKSENKLKCARESANNWRKERDYELKADLKQRHFANYLKPLILLAINTGLRQNEIFSLRWKDINFKTAMLTVSDTHAKSSKSRHVPLNEEALDILKKWQEDQLADIGEGYNAHESLVFPSKDGKKFNNIKRSWATLINLANIQDFRFHDLRHHFASRLVMAGVDLNTVRELLGHADIKMTLRYAHLAPQHKANAVAKLIRKDTLASAI